MLTVEEKIFLEAYKKRLIIVFMRLNTSLISVKS